jgi:four helix bundle protein
LRQFDVRRPRTRRIVSDTAAGIVAVPHAFDLEERLVDHACVVCRIAERLPQSVLGRHIARQLIRSGTSPAANYGEAQSAESRKDFVHKLKTALKELRESRVWLRLIERLGLVSGGVDDALVEEDELIAILVTSIRTASRHRGGSG